MSVEDHTIELAGSPVFFRSAPGPGSPVLHLHGVPTSSDDWPAFLERTGGIAPDLPGFGRSGKGGHLDYSPSAQADFLIRLLDHLNIDTVDVVAHDWGAAIAEAFVQQNPQRLGGTVLISPFPGLRGLARWWPRALIGELAMGSTIKRLLFRELRKGGSWPADRLSAIWEQFDQGTQRAILRMCRSAPDWSGTRSPAALTLVGAQDPWRPPRHPPNIPGAGHWPWLEDAGVIERVAQHLETR